MQYAYAKTDTVVANSNMSIEQRKAIGEKAISEYLSGKIDKLNIPGFTKYDGPFYYGREFNISHNPNLKNGTVIGYLQPTSSNGLITPYSVTTGLPIYTCNAVPSIPYSNTYFKFGGTGTEAGIILPDQSKRVTAIGATIDTNSLGSMQPGTNSVSEIFVLHLWGDPNILQTENDIVMGKDPNIPNMIDYTPYLSELNGYQTSIPIPVGHQVSVYIKAYTPAGGTTYSKIEMGMADYDTMEMYTFVYNLPYDANAYVGDTALEHAYDANLSGTGTLNQHRIATNFYAYDQNQQNMNLLRTGYIVDMRCYYPTGSGILRTHNGYSYQLDDYFAPNGHGTFNAWIY